LLLFFKLNCRFYGFNLTVNRHVIFFLACNNDSIIQPQSNDIGLGSQKKISLKYIAKSLALYLAQDGNSEFLRSKILNSDKVEKKDLLVAYLDKKLLKKGLNGGDDCVVDGTWDKVYNWNMIYLMSNIDYIPFGGKLRLREDYVDPNNGLNYYNWATLDFVRDIVYY